MQSLCGPARRPLKRNAAKSMRFRRISRFCAILSFAMSAPLGTSADDRLDSWKEIASYLGREVRTVQSWEKSEGLPVHRHQHARQGSVYAFKSELDGWRDARRGIPDSSPPAPAPASRPLDRAILTR